MLSEQQPHVYRKQHLNTKPRALFLNTVNQRLLFFILIGSCPPVFETLYFHFHRWTVRSDGDRADAEQEKAKFLRTVCFSIRKHSFSSKAHWIPIMSRGDMILLCCAVWLESTMEKIGEGIKWQLRVLYKSAENSQKNGGAWAEMGPVRLIECLCVLRNLYYLFCWFHPSCVCTCWKVQLSLSCQWFQELTACLFVWSTCCVTCQLGCQFCVYGIWKA